MKKFKFLSREKISQLPRGAGVYALESKGEILYIGKAANLRERVKSHFQQPGYKDYLFLDKVEKIGYIKTDSEIEALILEAKLIKELKPKFNVVWRDDKNYFFVGKTVEDFPRIFWTHQTKKSEVGGLKFKVEYVGPFVDGKALKETLKILRKVFPFRSCKKIPKRPCLWYHLGLCPAPCLLRSKFFEEIKESLKIRKISQKNAQATFEILKEGKDFVLKRLKREMKFAAKNQEFEEAARIRDQIEKLERVLAHSKILEEIKVESFGWEEVEEKLKKIFGLKKVSRIEAFDVSNIRGKLATGSMVTFVNGLPEKKFYRRFKIKFEKKPNDVAMIKEILTRRLSHLEWGLPDLILIDGGRAQLNAAKDCVKSNFKQPEFKVAALAKGKNELFLEGKENPILLEDLPNEISNLILRINSEAHRFAISYHRKLREKDLLNF